MKQFSMWAVLAFAVFLIGKSAQSANEQMSNVLLKNVEALAGVDDNWYCVGEKYTCLVDSQGEIKGKRYTIQ